MLTQRFWGTLLLVLSACAPAPDRPALDSALRLRQDSILVACLEGEGQFRDTSLPPGVKPFFGPQRLPYCQARAGR